MDPTESAEIGTTGIRVTQLGMGGAPFGGNVSEVTESAATEAVQTARRLGIRYFDTAPLYGRGKSEGFFGRVLADVPRDGFVLSTKVGRVLNPLSAPPEDDQWANPLPYEVVFDFSRDGVMRSLEESLKRLNLDRIDILLIHDPDDHHEQAITEAFPALAELRSQGVIRAIGAGMNDWQPLARFAREGDFDCFLLAGRYTLLDHSGLEELLPLCQEKSISIILGGPYNSGILASDLSPDTTYFYQRATPDVLDRARKLKAVCDRHSVPLKAAALQFGLAHPAVAATIPGAQSAAEVEENFSMAGHPIPLDLWGELRHEGLIPEAAPTPSSV
jgi:D-threo-aldose 1-dehydrogenase